MQKKQIGVGGVHITDKHKEYVMQVLNSGRLTYGPFTKTFEEKFSKLHGCSHAIMCSSGTSALRMALHALKELHGWNDGDEVIVPAVTFVATSNIILQNKLIPVFVDVHKEYYNIDPSKIEEKITQKTRAIIPVHLFGMPSEMDKIVEIAKKHQLKIIQDSCETMFATYETKPLGFYGDILCFSTYAAHIIVTGVGGLCCTNNQEYATKIRSLMNHGRNPVYLNIDDDKTNDKRKLFDIIDKRFTFESIGYSDRITEMEAALGLAELEHIEKNIHTRRSNAQFLLSNLKRFEEYIQLPEILPKAEHSFMMFPIVIKNPSIKKDDLVYYLEENHIETRPMLPLINQPIYQKMYGNLEEKYPIAKHINHNGFYIACHPYLTQEELTYIIDIFAKFFSQKQ